MFRSSHFLFLVTFGDEVTKIQKYIVIFCLSCKARHARKNKQTEHIVKKIMQLKWPKYKKTKIPKWNEPNKRLVSVAYIFEFLIVSGELIQSIKVHSLLNNWYEKSTNKILSRLNIVDLNFDDEMLSSYISLMACIGQAMGVKTFWRSFQTLIHRRAAMAGKAPNLA